MRYLAIILFLSLSSCSSKKKEIPPVSFFYDGKVEDLKAEKLQECKEDAIENAEKFVDSLIDRWIKDQNNKEIDFPNKPTRPNAPKKILGNG